MESDTNSLIKTERDFPYRKILIVGCGGAGKSTLAVELGRKLDLPVIHLDKLWWLPDWQTRSEEKFDELLRVELSEPSWIIEGNYARTFRRRLDCAEFCIFLDYPTELCIKSVYERADKYRGRTRPDMTKGCIEQVDPEFEQWIARYEKDVKPNMLAAMTGSGVPYKIFRSREQTSEWVKGL